MTEDRHLENNLQYLDDILGYLITSSEGYKLTFKQLYKYKFGRDLDSDNESHAQGYYKSLNHRTIEEFFNMGDNTYAQGEKLIEAMYFLNTEGYIRLDKNFTSKITYKGIIKYADGFVKEHKTQILVERFNKWNIVITILISIASLIAGMLINPC